MTFLTAWLLLILLFGAVTLFAVWSRKPTGYRAASVCAFILAAALSLPVALVPLGHCAPWSPAKGDYTVNGARIDVDVAIYVLLSADGPPRCYRLPYTTGKANELQEALDGEGRIGARINDEGGAAFEGEAPVTDDENKRAETPMYVPG